MWVTYYFSELVSNHNSSGEAELLTEPSQTELSWSKTGSLQPPTVSAALLPNWILSTALKEVYKHSSSYKIERIYGGFFLQLLLGIIYSRQPFL